MCTSLLPVWITVLQTTPSALENQGGVRKTGFLKNRSTVTVTLPWKKECSQVMKKLKKKKKQTPNKQTKKKTVQEIENFNKRPLKVLLIALGWEASATNVQNSYYVNFNMKDTDIF